MQVKRMLSLALMVVGFAACAAPVHSGVQTFVARSAGVFAGLAGIFSAMTEPVRLVVMGIVLIALSVLVRRRKNR